MNNDCLVIVDIQPEYQRDFDLMIYDMVAKINETNKPIICFYVGRELSLDDKYSVIGLFLENGVDENKVNEMKFIEKDFGFFRCWMDLGVKEDIILNTLRVMYENGINDSRNLSDENWDEILSTEDRKTFFLYDEPLIIPDFDKRLLNYFDNFELIGGGRWECLEEINLYLKSINKNTFVNEDFCYGTQKNINDKIKKTNKKLKI